MKNLIISSILLLTILSGCFYSFYPQTGSGLQKETNPEAIQIYSGDINQDYEVIGSITAIAIGDADAVKKLLTKKASKLGADAIIRVDLSKTSSTSLRTGISGVAIKLMNSEAQTFN